MAITIGVHASAGSTNGNSSVTPSRTTQASTCIVVGVSYGDSASAVAVTDNKGNTYTQIGLRLRSSLSYGQTTALFVCANATGGAGHTVTATLSGQFPSVLMVELVGGGITLDQSIEATDTSTPYVSGQITPSQANCAVVSYAGLITSNSSAYAAGNGMTLQENVTDIEQFYSGGIATLIQTTAAAIEGSWSSPGNTVDIGLIHTASFKQSGGGPTTIETVGAATGSGTATGVSGSTKGTVGASAGTGTATGISAAIRASVGAATGSGAAAAISAVILGTVGASQGASTAQAQSAAFSGTSGEASGSSTAQAQSGTLIGSDAQASGTSTAEGVSSAYAGAVGLSESIASVEGLSAFLLETVGEAAGSCTVIGRSGNTPPSGGLRAYAWIG